MGRRLIHPVFTVIVICLLFVTAVFGADFVTLTVRKGDTLTAISQKNLDNPAKWPAIAKANKLKDPHFISPGQQLIIPVALLKGTPQNGLVTFLKGEAAYRKPGSKQWEALGPNEKVPQGAFIRTGAESAL